MAGQRVLSDRYRLLVKVGEGGMAEVYRAQDTLLGRAVAVKLLRPQYNSESSFLVRFLQEAQAAAGLSHPNIVTVYDVGQDGEQRYIVMEYVEGVSLKEIILESAPFSVDRAVDIGLQICRAVGVAHRAGLVHRDIKPQNVLFTADGRVKVTDFGIARALGAPKSLTEEGTVWGTPHYISPEQASGEEVGPPSDVYSIGIVMFEMLAGRLPFDGPSSVAIAMKHVREPAPPVTRWNSAVPPDLARMIARALSKSPEDRYATASEFAQALRVFQRTRQERAEVPEPITPPSSASAARSRAGYPSDSARSNAWSASPERLPRMQQAGEDSRERHERIDPLTVGLVAVAFIAMIGLIPLGIFLFQSFTSKPPPTPLPPPTPIILRDDIRVPSLVGVNRDDATNLVLTAGLRMDVVEERNSDSVPLGRIIEQERQPGQLARRGDIIRVVVSKGPKPVTVQLPRYVGQDVTEVKKDIESKGLVAETADQWGGTTPTGLVMQQDPPENAVVQPGSTLKLAVSTGPRINVKAVIDGSIALMAFDLERDNFNAGETLPLTLYWTATTAQRQDFSVFVHLMKDGQMVAQQDNPPVQGARPTSGWVPEEMIRDPYALVIPANAAPGTYWLEVGMYNQAQQRQAITNPGSVNASNSALLLKEITIQKQ
jgi:eukaryotic-like serine/threonine-protein kinase